MDISIIAAIAENNVIGFENKLIWHIKEDLQRFKSLTMGHHIIMGRKTYESIGRPLPGRTNIIITRNKDFIANGCIIVNSLEEAIKSVHFLEDNIFIIGGAEIYKQAYTLADRLYLTRVHAEFVGDVYFPEINNNDWIVENINNRKSIDCSLDYTFVDLIRR